MSSLNSEALLCAICGKTAGNFTCRGCGQGFCANHVIEHRQILNKKLDEIIQEHDQLKESLIQGAGKLQPDLLVAEIDEWEKESHEIIRRMASEYRIQLRATVNKITTERLGPTTEELKKARENDTFVETNLNTWATKLETLKNEVTILHSINIKRDDYDKSCIPQLLVIETLDDVFEESNGNVIIGDSSRVITHGFWSSYGAVRGKGEYSSRCYQFHFKLEAFDKTSVTGLSFGIISKLTPMKKTSFEDTSYGWVGFNRVKENTNNEFGLVSVGGHNYNRERSGGNTFLNFQQNDIFELLIDCNRKKIRLTNKRTNEVEEIAVDDRKCPFPWQLNCSVSHWYQRLRLLTTSDSIDTKK
jgi:hypothetical protein